MPPTELDTVVVVGASLAGARAVQALRREGFAGRLVVVGAEPHWPPYDRPPLSKQVLTGEWEPEQARLRGLDAVDADLVLGRRAVSLDLEGGSLTLDDGATLAFDGLVVATGAAPRQLPGTPPTLAGVHVLRTIDDASALRRDLVAGRRVAVIGAGFIGSEVASSCRALGLDVTLIEALDLPLQRILGPGMGEVAAELHRTHGVALRLAVGVRQIVGEGGRVERVVLSDGSSLDADVVVVGIGVTPTTGWLEGSGLAIDDGLVCDSACVAVGSSGRVVAAGDVARWHNPLFDVSMRVEHWTNAGEQAAHAARALVHGAETAGPFAPVPYFWSDQHGTKFQFVGTSAATDDVVVVEGSIDDGKFVAAYGRDGVAVGALCVNWPARMNPWRKAIESRSPFPG